MPGPLFCSRSHRFLEPPPAAKYTARVLLFDDSLAREQRQGQAGNSGAAAAPQQAPHESAPAAGGVEAPLHMPHPAGRPTAAGTGPPQDAAAHSSVAQPWQGTSPAGSLPAGLSGLPEGMPEPEIAAAPPAASTAEEALLAPADSQGSPHATAGRLPPTSVRLTQRVAPGLRNPAAADALGDVQVSSGPGRGGPRRPANPRASRWFRCTLPCHRCGAPSRPPLLPTAARPPAPPARWTCTPARQPCWARWAPPWLPPTPTSCWATRCSAAPWATQRSARRSWACHPCCARCRACHGSAQRFGVVVTMVGRGRRAQRATAAGPTLVCRPSWPLCAPGAFKDPASIACHQGHAAGGPPGPCPACRRRVRSRMWAAAAPTTPQTSTRGRPPVGCTAPAASCSMCGASCGRVRGRSTGRQHRWSASSARARVLPSACVAPAPVANVLHPPGGPLCTVIRAPGATPGGMQPSHLVR